jgi:Family of unknown function (DUF5752)
MMDHQTTGSAQGSFQIKDCALITRMAGISSVMNLRELHERLQVCPLESLYHHFCETQIRASFDDPEFRNDFAIWASRHLGDRVLAERLGMLNPYASENLLALQERLFDIVEVRISENPQAAWYPANEEFRFMQAATVIFDTGQTLASAADLLAAIPQLSASSVYYHFVEARRRTAGRLDDFSAWLKDLAEETTELERSFAGIDFYFLSLRELKRALVQICWDLTEAEEVSP